MQLLHQNLVTSNFFIFHHFSSSLLHLLYCFAFSHCSHSSLLNIRAMERLKENELNCSKGNGYSYFMFAQRISFALIPSLPLHKQVGLSGRCRCSASLHSWLYSTSLPPNLGITPTGGCVFSLFSFQMHAWLVAMCGGGCGPLGTRWGCFDIKRHQHMLHNVTWQNIKIRRIVISKFNNMVSLLCCRISWDLARRWPTDLRDPW